MLRRLFGSAPSRGYSSWGSISFKSCRRLASLSDPTRVVSPVMLPPGRRGFERTRRRRDRQWLPNDGTVVVTALAAHAAGLPLVTTRRELIYNLKAAKQIGVDQLPNEVPTFFPTRTRQISRSR
jgi:hypothetical protein